MPRKPNILLIIADAHNARMGGFANQPLVDTAALNQISAHGATFTSAYCQAVRCAESRRSILTGKWPRTCNAWAEGAHAIGDHATIATALKAQGYATAAVGKLGIEGGPTAFDFDDRPFGDLFVTDFDGAQPDPPETADGSWRHHKIGRLSVAGPTALPESLLNEYIIASESVSWLLEHMDANGDQPWFFCCSFARPQFPLTAPGRYFRHYQETRLPVHGVSPDFPNGFHEHDQHYIHKAAFIDHDVAAQERALAAYAASIDFMDECVATILSRLWETDAMRNTYVIYTSDHGEMAGDRGMWWADTYYEHAVRVPLLISGPGIANGTVVDAPVELVDILPTCCSMADADQPDDIDGQTLAPLLKNAASEHTRAFAHSELLVGDEAELFRTVRLHNWKYVAFPKFEPRLFNLETDPHEERDLIDRVPVDTPLDVLEELAAQLGDWTVPASQPVQTHPGRTHGSMQYRLASGRFVPADRQLYPQG